MRRLLPHNFQVEILRKEVTPEEKYLESHSAPVSEALLWLERQTHLRSNYPRMLAGKEVGRLITALVRMLQPQNVLELGTFTGYSAICIAQGLPEGGHLDTLEVNDEMEDLIREGFERAGVAGKITLHISDALETIPTLDRQYDLAYIDANKRDYPRYLDAVVPLVRKGGWIIADNVLWDGKVWAEKPDSDAQTRGIIDFNEKVAADPRLENFILPLRDGWNIIRVL